MIPLEKQVCTIEQAKKFKELGVKQSSILKWEYRIEPHEFWSVELSVPESWAQVQDRCSAFTCAELGVMLPPHYFTYPQTGGTFNTLAYKTPDGIVPSGVLPTCYNTEAEARAAMLIHLIESKLITVEEINSKL